MTHPVINITRRADITFHPDGRIDLTAHVAKTLDLNPGDVVNIAEEEGDSTEHYLYVSRRGGEATGRHACTCRRVKSGHYLRVFSKPLATHILHQCHTTQALSLRVGRPTALPGIGTALPLITACHQ
jgi:hypothetical protein